MALPSRSFMRVQGAGRALIAFHDPVGYPRPVLPGRFDAAVGRSAVDDDELEVRIGLQQHRANRFFDEGSLVE